MVMAEAFYRTLYRDAKLKAEAIPEIDNKLAGSCTTVSYFMLDRARKMLGNDIRLSVGWIEYKGEKKWHFTDEDIERWRLGIVKPTNMVHCWLQSDDHLLDLTLASTLYEIEKRERVTLIPSGITYIDRKCAEQLDIRHTERLFGDNVLFELNF